MSREKLCKLAQDGLALMRDLEMEKERVNPWWTQTSKGVMMLWGTKIGLGVGGRFGHGFLIAKLPPSLPNNPPRWSAPLFLRVRVAQFGLCFGYAQSRTYALVLSDRTLRDLEHSGHTMIGMDQTFAIPSTTPESKSDVIALSSGPSTDLVVSSLVNGLMLDFSFAGGSINVDMGAMKEIYGQGVSVHAVLSGAVPPAQEMAPLYDHLAATLVRVKTPAPHLTRASLARMTMGIDPDRRIVTSSSARLLHKGDSAENVRALEE